jgi:hypothetical protein
MSAAIERLIGYLLAMSTEKKEPTNYERRNEWVRIHAEIMGKLDLPCDFEFSTDHRVGAHVFYEWQHSRTCAIRVNPDGNFRVPVHLILHEAAHHRNTIKCEEQDYKEQDHNLSKIERECCLGGWSIGHCPHWAAELVECYRICNIELPESTQFHEFAKAAHIEWRPHFPAVDGSVGRE